MLRELVTSATYRQDSRLRPGLREKDPANILLARGPARRLAAEPVRDVLGQTFEIELIERLQSDAAKLLGPCAKRDIKSGCFSLLDHIEMNRISGFARLHFIG